MSALEHDPQAEARSSVKITRNAKGDAQVEVKVYAGELDDELDRIRRLAVAQYQALLQELRATREA